MSFDQFFAYQFFFFKIFVNISPIYLIYPKNQVSDISVITDIFINDPEDKGLK